MCNGNCMCENEQQDFSNKQLDAAYRRGYEDAFANARKHFWAEFMVKSGDMKMIYQQLRQSSGQDSVEADALAIIEATYMNVADAILRGSREFPGYLEDNEQPWDTQEDENRDRPDGHSDCDCH